MSRSKGEPPELQNKSLFCRTYKPVPKLFSLALIPCAFLASKDESAWLIGSVMLKSSHSSPKPAVE